MNLLLIVCILVDRNIFVVGSKDIVCPSTYDLIPICIPSMFFPVIIMESVEENNIHRKKNNFRKHKDEP